MPMEHTVTIVITCGNPRCPGHQLDTTDRSGWTFVNVEVYGDPVMPQRVFCGWNCMAIFTNAVSKDLAEWRLPMPEPLPATLMS